MSNTKAFLRKNKIIRKNVKFMATESIVDEQGIPLDWEIRPISSRDNETIREECTDVQRDKSGNMMPSLNSRKYLHKLLVASIALPDLLNAELQDSYGVTDEADLLYEMLDSPADYAKLCTFVQKFNGYDISMDEKIEEAKN